MFEGLPMALRKVNSVLELIGGTPLVRIGRMNPVAGVEVFAKLESLNPGGSVKDRIALSMIEQGEAGGELTRDKIVLEASSGNTAIGLAMVCAVKGYRLLVTMSESASQERRKILKAYGARILLTPGYLGTDGAIEEAYRLAREEPGKYFLVDQFNNEANWRAHFEGTGNEIWEATGGKVDVVVLTMGTTGTLMGITRALRQRNPAIRVVGVEPFKSHKIQGLKNMKESYPPGIFKPEELSAIVNVEDEAAYEAARRLAREEGIFAGMSAGAAMKVALDEAKALGKGVVVALLPDGGERYLSTPLFLSDSVPVPLRLYNSLTRQVEPLEPVSPGKVTVYSCGPSLDGPPDLGLCRRVVVSDVLRRYLEYRGYEVKHAMNLGDIDDRTINECLKAGKKLKEFTAEWEKAFYHDLEALRVVRAHHYLRASEHVNGMVEQTRKLLEKGLAYEKLRSVYYRISSFPEYGKLSGIAPDEVRAEASTTYDYYEKDNPRDFALLKRATLAELKAGIYWDTPWGKVRPGWHVECSSMATGCLGQPIDIHTASRDLVFPHGDNEIAIASGLAGKPLAKVWMHCEVVQAAGKKVSRALGNALTLGDLSQQGFAGPTVRYWILATHYRKVLNYSQVELQRAGQCVSRLNQFVRRLQCLTAGKRSDDLDQALYEAHAGWQEAMDNDLHIPKALGKIFAFIRYANRCLNGGTMDGDQVQRSLDFMRQVNRVLDVVDFEPPRLDARVQQLVEARRTARRMKDFQRADEIREELRPIGVRIADSRWRES